jgi:hypothetical protein
MSTDAPSGIDSEIRRLICEDISRSGFFLWAESSPTFDSLNLNHPRILNRTSIANPQDSTELTNAYRERILNFVVGTGKFREYVFTCYLKDWLYGDTHSFYVSKEYNVAPPDAVSYKPGRFVFEDRGRDPLLSFDDLVLAEEPANVYTEPEFNIELYYLRVRKHMQPGNKMWCTLLCTYLHVRRFIFTFLSRYPQRRTMISILYAN